MKDSIIYSRLLKQAQDSPDGETPTKLYLTKEVNFYILFVAHYYGDSFVAMFNNWERDKAIEFAVNYKWSENDNA